MREIGSKFIICVCKNALFVALVVCALSFSLSGVPENTDDNVMKVRPNATGSPAELIEKHNCHNPGGIPSGVIVRYTNDVSATYQTSQKAIHDSLEFEFNNADNGVAEVVAFC